MIFFKEFEKTNPNDFEKIGSPEFIKISVNKLKIMDNFIIFNFLIFFYLFNSLLIGIESE